MFKGIIKLVLFLNSNRYIGEVAWAVSLAFLLALIPANNLIWVVLLIVGFLIRINHGVMILFTLIFGLITSLFDPLLDRIGYWVLSMPGLETFWNKLYDLPLMPLTKFNHTLVMGALIVGLIALFPIYLLSGFCIRWYRNNLQERVANTKLFRWFKKVPLVNKFGKALRMGSKLR